jgi:hypothetical protein
MYHPEHLKENQIILFREGRTKGLGVISKVHSQQPGAGLKPQAGMNKIIKPEKEQKEQKKE